MRKIFLSSFLTFLFLNFAHAQETVSEDFRALIRYYFLTYSKGSSRGSKEFRCESLPASKIIRDPRYGTIRVVDGYVTQLPYHFIIKIIKKSRHYPGIIEVNIIDPNTNKSLDQFPTRMTDCLEVTQNPSDESAAFQFKVPKSLENKLVKKYFSSPESPSPNAVLAGPMVEVGIGKRFFDEIKYYENSDN